MRRGSPGDRAERFGSTPFTDYRRMELASGIVPIFPVHSNGPGPSPYPSYIARNLEARHNAVPIGSSERSRDRLEETYIVQEHPGPD